MKKEFFFKRRKRQRTRDFRKGIYLLPNFFTTCSLFCGFYSIIASFKGDFVPASWAIIFAGIFDWLDGKIARLSHTMTQFGKEYDSLSDVIAFGLAPALMLYTWALVPFGKVGWLAAFLFAACAALRLARFNVHAANMDLRYFFGMPTPAAAGVAATTVIFVHHANMNWGEASRHITILLMTFCLAFLMVSKFRYQSLKQLELMGKMPFQVLVLIICFLILIYAQPEICLFIFAWIYTLSAPLLAMKRKIDAWKKQPVHKEGSASI